jgi:predicted P-loop ATPase
LKEYVRNYLAHLLQQPLDLPGVAIIFTGKKGTGKDTMIDLLMEFVFGYKYTHNYENNNDFFEKHDLGRKDKFLVKIEEADRMLCMSNASALKSRITSKTETFNPKGQGKITTSNYCRFIFTTNKPNPVEMNDGERRFVIIPTSSDRKGDHIFWNKIRSLIILGRKYTKRKLHWTKAN